MTEVPGSRHARAARRRDNTVCFRFDPYLAMAAVPSSLFDLPLSAAYDSARWSKAALDVWTGSLASSAAIALQREQRLSHWSRTRSSVLLITRGCIASCG